MGDLERENELTGHSFQVTCESFQILSFTATKSNPSSPVSSGIQSFSMHLNAPKNLKKAEPITSNFEKRPNKAAIWPCDKLNHEFFLDELPKPDLN
jgi:hypothetical protein